MAATSHAPQPPRDANVRIIVGRVDSPYVEMVLIAVMIGLAFVFSATFPPTGASATVKAAFEKLGKQALFAVIGIIGMAVFCHVKPRRALQASLPLFVLGLLAMLACCWGPLAKEVKGAFCRLHFTESLGVQPSEFAKFAYVILLASFMAKPLDKDYTFGKMFLRCMIALAAICGALLLQRDLGMMVLIVGVTLAMLFLRGFKPWVLILFILVTGLGGLAYAKQSESRWKRITVFLDPTSDPSNAGYHSCQLLATVGRGGLSGTSFGMSKDKWGALPEADTDSINALIVGELGLAGAVLVAGLFFAMAWRTLHLAERAANPSAWFLGAGIGLCIVIQALIHMGVTTVSIPCTGITLPFVSYGGSSLVASLCAAGLVLSVSRYRRAE